MNAYQLPFVAQLHFVSIQVFVFQVKSSTKTIAITTLNVYQDVVIRIDAAISYTVTKNARRIKIAQLLLIAVVKDTVLMRRFAKEPKVKMTIVIKMKNALLNTAQIIFACNSLLTFQELLS